MTNLRNKIVLAILLLISLAAIDLLAGRLVIPVKYNEFRCAHPYYHHGLLPGRHDISLWGAEKYPVYTNSLGMRDASARKIQLVPSKRRILFIGDSFTEGIGVPYENTFAGIIGRKLDADVLNSGVVGYSPRLYYLKTKYLLESVGLKFDEAVVMIDISDILNELEYEDYIPNMSTPPVIAENSIASLLSKYSALYYLISSRLKSGKPTGLQEKLAGITPCWGGRRPEIYNSRIEAAWTSDGTVFEKFGKRGLELANNNMDLLIDMLKKHKITPYVVVYPWPAQIYSFDKDCIQARYWRNFSKVKGVTFIDLFPVFIDEKRYSGPDEVYTSFFIQGDIHWNSAGHDVVASSIVPALQKGQRMKSNNMP